eukprot:SAG31_NODE_46589_length_253_cov_5.941558_1_plen_55_part_10
MQPWLQCYACVLLHRSGAPRISIMQETSRAMPMVAVPALRLCAMLCSPLLLLLAA